MPNGYPAVTALSYRVGKVGGLMHASLSLAPARSQIEDSLRISLAVLLALAGLSWCVFSYGYIEDDAFIHLEFARSLTEGAGFSFNGHVVNGDTAPLWVILLSAIHASGLTWINTAKLLDGLGVLLALSGVWRVASELAHGASRQYGLAPVAVLLTAVNPYFVHWSFSGMESAAALGVSLWMIWFAFSGAQPSGRPVVAGAALASIAPLLRPELLLLSAATGLAILRHAYVGSTNSHARRTMTVAILAICMALPVILWSGYALHAFGAIMPNTNAAKRAGSFLAAASKLVSVYGVGFAPTLVLFPFVAARLGRRVPIMIWALIAWPSACALFYLADHTAVQTRYSLLSMPSLTVATLWLLREVVAPAKARAFEAGMAVVSILILIVIVIPHVANKVQLVKTVSNASAYIRNEIPAEAPIAVYSIGQFAFEARHPLIDIGGITQPGVLPYLGDLSAAIRWARESGARYYIGGQSPQPNAELVFSYTEPFLGWTFDRSEYRSATLTGIYRMP